MMKGSVKCLLLLGFVFALAACKKADTDSVQPVHEDKPFLQDISKKFNLQDSVQVRQVAADRNGVIQVSTSHNLYKPRAGELLYPGLLVPERYYRPVADKKIATVGLYKDHLVYLDDKAVLSNA